MVFRIALVYFLCSVECLEHHQWFVCAPKCTSAHDDNYDKLVSVCVTNIVAEHYAASEHT